MIISKRVYYAVYLHTVRGQVITSISTVFGLRKSVVIAYYGPVTEAGVGRARMYTVARHAITAKTIDTNFARELKWCLGVGYLFYSGIASPQSSQSAAAAAAAAADDD